MTQVKSSSPLFLTTGNEWLLPVCSEGPASCPLVPRPRLHGQATGASGFCPQSSLRVAGGLDSGSQPEGGVGELPTDGGGLGLSQAKLGL